jgi:hypothetical protein
MFKSVAINPVKSPQNSTSFYLFWLFFDILFDLGNALFKIADALADAGADLRQPAGPENNQHNHQDNQKFPVSESEHVASCSFLA